MTAENKSARLEELFKKGAKLTQQEKIELNALLSQDIEQGKTETLKKVVEELRAIIKSNGLEIAEVAEALEVVFFKVPYEDKNKETKLYNWASGKKAVGVTAKYYDKLKSATLEEKKAWATPDGLEWLETEEGKAWLKS